MKTEFPVEYLQTLQTPFYYYDTELLRATLDAVRKQLDRHPQYVLHYAVKANTNPRLLEIIRDYGFGVDCVSGGEVQTALDRGFDPEKIVYAGVGKSDWEILLGIRSGIFCFNVESVPELEVINELAQKEGRIVNVCFRINPNVGAHTHHNITTGQAENKFGISMEDMIPVILHSRELSNVNYKGLHFHIGSQILDMNDFERLCKRINSLLGELEEENITTEIINVGGGLGIDYESPDINSIPDFESYFDTYAEYLNLKPFQTLHFELGRALVAQCGSLIARTLYVKEGAVKKFVILDAGMTDLIRPALYDAHHHIQNLSNTIGPLLKYDVVGPVCESSDVFDKDILLPESRRGDLFAIRSAGAYGEVMASCYNCRHLPKSYLDTECKQ